MLVIDVRDSESQEALRQTGLRVHVTKTLMRTPADKAELATSVLSAVRSQAAAAGQEQS
jgi:hypothetical protein